MPSPASPSACRLCLRAASPDRLTLLLEDGSPPALLPCNMPLPPCCSGCSSADPAPSPSRPRIKSRMDMADWSSSPRAADTTLWLLLLLKPPRTPRLPALSPCLFELFDATSAEDCRLVGGLRSPRLGR
eukprot:1159522-Pelagomonas_calceolata.AAC.3